VNGVLTNRRPEPTMIDAQAIPLVLVAAVSGEDIAREEHRVQPPLSGSPVCPVENVECKVAVGMPRKAHWRRVSMVSDNGWASSCQVVRFSWSCTTSWPKCSKALRTSCSVDHGGSKFPTYAILTLRSA
jgi:hypothetical protein